MQKRVTLILEPEDVALIKSVSKDPCITCSDEVLGCVNCPKRLKYTEMVKNIPEEHRETIQELADAYREYTEAVNTINELQTKIEKLKNDYHIDRLDAVNEAVWFTLTLDIIDLNNGGMRK